jgi:hypothetical protein
MVISIYLRKYGTEVKEGTGTVPVIFKVCNKVINKEMQRPQKYSCKSWSRRRSRNSDLWLRGAGAERYIYGSAKLLANNMELGEERLTQRNLKELIPWETKGGTR